MSRRARFPGGVSIVRSMANLGGDSTWSGCARAAAKRLPLWVLFAAAAFSGGCGLKFDPQRHPQAIMIPEQGVEERITLIKNLPLVQVYLGDAGPYWFGVDTGCAMCFVDDDVALALEMKRKMRFGRIVTSAGTSSGRMDVARFESLRIGEAQFDSFEGLVSDLALLERHMKHPMHGIIGMPVIEQGVWTIDYPGSALRIESAATELPADDRTLEFVWSGNTPALHINMGERQLCAEIDTGSANGMIISASDARKLELDLDGSIRTRHLSLNGAFWQDLVRLDGEVTFGPVTLSDLMVHLGRETMIGGAVLSRFVLSIDSARRRIRFAAPAGELSTDETGTDGP